VSTLLSSCSPHPADDWNGLVLLGLISVRGGSESLRVYGCALFLTGGEGSVGLFLPSPPPFPISFRACVRSRVGALFFLAAVSIFLSFFFPESFFLPPVVYSVSRRPPGVFSGFLLRQIPSGSSFGLFTSFFSPPESHYLSWSIKILALGTSFGPLSDSLFSVNPPPPPTSASLRPSGLFSKVASTDSTAFLSPQIVSALSSRRLRLIFPHVRNSRSQGFRLYTYLTPGSAGLAKLLSLDRSCPDLPPFGPSLF